ncbi:hypothetical protein P389DRAFT_209278 [Cystobasidium minutum MCA 4210]|uniref:uncharacterized protein n=1 Tax=Cystobasidium minutum MCA 4210 TaxID=1397322 RepID=UPI0034CEB57A|eukprot:jgi/Rhomi1/209278/estExt_Genemark1.C_2_t30117
MNSRSFLHSISSTPRRPALPLLVLVGVALLLLGSPTTLVYTPTSDADTFGGSHDLDGIESFRGQQAQQPPSQRAIEQLHQQEYHNDPSFAGSSQKDQWDWEWIKKATTNKMKESFGWSESESYTRGRRPSDSISSPSSSGGKTPTLHGSSSEADDSDDNILAYHRHLEKEHSPHKYLKHSPTLTFDHIYVLSLPHRTDRRSRMNKIAHALGLKFTFVDATGKDSPLIGWIAERVKEIRERKVKILAPLLGKPESEIGGMGTGSLWLKGDDEKIGLTFPDLKTLDDRWKIDRLKAASLSNDPVSNEQDEQIVASDFSGQQVVDWVTYLDSTDKLDMLKPSVPHLNVSELLYDPVEPLPARQVNDGVVATWYSQTRVWKKMVENKDKSALILEDDVDMEWDIERIWPNIERALAPDWEVVFLGHCWGRELGKPQYVHPQLHKASEPRCLHGYAVSQKGAQHLLELFSDPWRAYQTPVDTFMPFLTRYTPPPPRGEKPKKLKAIEKLDPPMYIQAYSMEPAVIIQSKELSSDIQDGLGSNWRGLLADSTWDRILRDEGHDVKQLTYDETKYDPAIKARPWGDWGKAKPAAAPKHPDETAETPKSPFELEKEDRQGEGQPKLTPEEQKSKAREEAMNRVVDPEQLEKDRVLQNLPKRPGPMMEGGKNKAGGPGAGSNQDVAAAHIQAAIEAAKKGGAHGGRRKGDGNRVGTGPKRLGSDGHE